MWSVTPGGTGGGVHRGCCCMQQDAVGNQAPMSQQGLGNSAGTPQG